jgi:transposase-like protein
MGTNFRGARLNGLLQAPPFSPQIIAYAVWGHCLLAMRLGEVRDLFAESGFVVSHEILRKWLRQSITVRYRKLESYRARVHQADNASLIDALRVEVIALIRILRLRQIYLATLPQPAGNT